VIPSWPSHPRPSGVSPEVESLPAESRPRRLTSFGWLLLGVAGALLSVAVPVYALSTDREQERRQYAENLAQLEEACADFESHNQQLQERIAALQTNPLYIEKATRSHLGWVKDGELIFLFDARSEQPGAMGAAPR